MSIISKQSWNNLTQEEQHKLKTLYMENEEYGCAENNIDLERIFPKDCLQSQSLTYDNVARKLFDHDSTVYVLEKDRITEIKRYVSYDGEYNKPTNCTSQKQAEKLLAINRLLNVAKFLNKGWKPDWSDDEDKWSLCIDPDTNKVKTIKVYHTEVNRYVVYFRTEELAKQAIQILGEDVIRLALTTEY